MSARANFLQLDLSKFGNYLTESTYVPFNNFTSTQSILVYHLPRIGVVLDDHDSGNNNNATQYDYSRNWSRTICVCQKMDKEIFGFSFVVITGFNSKKIDMKLLWLTCTIPYNRIINARSEVYVSFRHIPRFHRFTHH